MFLIKKILLCVLLISGLTQGIPVKDSTKISKTLIRKFELEPRQLVWVFFTDKGLSDEMSFYNPEEILSKKSIERRDRRFKQIFVDETDFPLYPQYLDKLQETCFVIRQRSKWFNGVSGFADSSIINKISALPFVKNIDIVSRYKSSSKISATEYKPVQVIQPESVALDYGASFTQLNQINVPELHNLGYSGQGVTICVLDAGFNNLEHEVFTKMNIIAAYDFVNNDANVDDENDHGSGSHGTATLSVIGGFKEGNLIGPAYSSNYILAKTEDTDSETPVEEDNWIAAIEWAESLGVDVTSTSLGYKAYDSPYQDYTWTSMDGNTCRITIAADLAVKKGIVVVNAAGNDYDNANYNTLGAPADGDSVITIGAVNSSGIRVDFSSVGLTADGRIKPDLMAMGRGVTVAGTHNASDYYTGDGTSFACPLAAGVIAQILSFNPNLTPMQILEALRNTASNKDNPDKYYGWGIINAFAATNYFSSVPVELTGFNAKVDGDKIILRWDTQTENNLLGFNIERKYGDSFPANTQNDFVKIGFVKADGSSAGSGSYMFADKPELAGLYQYRLKQIDLDGKFIFSQIINTMLAQPKDLVLYQNYPNPFNPSTKIKFEVPGEALVKIELYDIIGRKTAVLFSDNLDAGIYEKEIDFNSLQMELSSGIYFIKLTSGSLQRVLKISYLK
ncbi:MAG: T9SS C-terminal target domain-containing protein [Ignavibacteriales bacterium]|nr:MAG: T9SS C-terminal target domain-containing protein [Ignavibacteriales bacterium]